MTGKTWRRVLRVVTGTVIAFAGTVATLAAQAQGEFKPLTDEQLARQQEVLPATPLVFIAYAFVWVALIFYVAMLWRRLGRVEQELAGVSEKLRDRAGRR